jgi:hypothetical protein
MADDHFEERRLGEPEVEIAVNPDVQAPTVPR